MELRWNAADSAWTGSGYYQAGGVFARYDEMAGSDGDAKGTLQKAAAGVVAGAELDAFNPVDFNPSLVSAQVTVHAPAAGRDRFGRLPLVIGAPGGGLPDALPHDVRLYLSERGAPVQLPSPLTQSVQVTLHLGGLDVVRLPDAGLVQNEAGRFELAVRREGDTVTVTRSLALAKARYTPEEWPALRELLLAETDAANRTVLLR